MVQTSISQRLNDKLNHLIAETDSGGRLPSEPDLARQLGVSRATLREAMRAFEVQGLITRRQGSGTFVNHPSKVIETGLEVLVSIEMLAMQIGLQVTIGDLQIEIALPNAEEQDSLDISETTSVTRVFRVILVENRPVAYLIDVLPSDILSPQQIKGNFKSSILDLLLQRGEPALSYSKTNICAVPASSELARHLGIQRADVLLCFIAELYSDAGRVIDYSHSYFLPGYFRFHVNRKVG